MNKALKQLNSHELYQLSAQIEDDPHSVASQLFPDKPDRRLTLTETIGQWAINQAVMLESVENGKPEVATVFNKVGDRIWQKLPTYAQCLRINIE